MIMRTRASALHYPRLDTILMIEDNIKNAENNLSKTELWEALPKKVMYQTFKTVIDYLIDSGKIIINNGKLEWVYSDNEKKEGMAKNNYDEIKKKIVAILKKKDVEKAAIFGSAVRGEMTDKSDVDIAIKFRGKHSLFDLAGIKIELEEELGKKVDIMTYDSIYPDIKKKILKEQEVIL